MGGISHFIGINKEKADASCGSIGFFLGGI